VSTAAGVVPYLGLFAAAAAFEFSYVAWARAAARDRVAATVFFSTATAGLGLLGLRGALELAFGWVPYLGGIAVGAGISAYLGRRALLNTVT
jgi:hypothetical protein